MVIRNFTVIHNEAQKNTIHKAVNRVSFAERTRFELVVP